METNPPQLSSERRSVVKQGAQIACIAVGLFVALWLVVQWRHVLVLVLFALVLSAGLDPLVNRLHGWRLPWGGGRFPRWLAILGLLFVMVLVLGGSIGVLAWFGWSEAQRLFHSMPMSEDAILSRIDRLREVVPAIPPREELISMFRSQLQELGSYLRSTISVLFNVAGAVSSGLLVLVLVFYMLLDKETLHRGFLSLIPPRHQTRVDGVVREALRTMGGWLRGQLILMLLMGTVIGTTMALAGMPYPLLMALIGALGELVPMVGPIAAGWFVVPISLFTQPAWMTILIVVFFLALSVIEGNYVVPKVMQANVNLPPFFTVLVVLLGAGLVGIPGALLAIPISAGLRLVIQRLAVPAIQGGSEGPSSTPNEETR